MNRRIIPCLDTKAGRVVKGTNFVNLRDCGDPVELASLYNKEGADELVLLNLGGPKDQDIMVELVRRAREQISIPLTVGGGIGSTSAMEKFLSAGADKVSISSAAVDNPELIAAGSRSFGKEAIVVAIDAKQTGPDSWEVYTHGGTKATGLQVRQWAEEVAGLGAGEILLTSMDRDGTNRGYDNNLNRAVAQAIELPLIASGGAGTLEHLAQGAEWASGLLVASMFHFGHYTIRQAKEYLKAQGIEVGL
jgi:cyclase